MSANWRHADLPDLVATLARRPGHEAIRTLLADLLHNAFAADYAALDHEVRMPEIRGRADVLFGAVVFELKSDLRRESGDVLARLPDYLAERERITGRRFLGIATDGATFAAFELRDGSMAEIGRHEVRADDPDALLAWLEPALSTRDELTPEPLVFRRELGRESLTFGRAKGILDTLWARLSDHPEVALKRQLWDGLLRQAYGSAVGDDTLFLQHTYLTIIAKTIAARVLDLPTTDAAAILSGREQEASGLYGAVESDFFDWVLLEPEGADLIRRVARQVARFRLRDVEVDVLKTLYESLIDPAQRHDLGEYYTPDWLAAKLTAEVITDPLRSVVLDPACGSGTFLFHCLRRLVAAGQAAGWSNARIASEAANRVRGLDIHPVAVIIARVTWLLALAEVIQDRDEFLTVPVYLGDALQWNLSRIADKDEVMLPVPGERPLTIPASTAESDAVFEAVLRAFSDGLEQGTAPATIEIALGRIADLPPLDRPELVVTYTRLLALKQDGRNGIWPFVLRNLVRPIWLSRPGQRADVVIGNPPWVAYRHLSAEMKPRLRDACQAMNLWIGGILATQQDLAALFWARAAERYLEPGGTIAFVLPYAALNRPAFGGMRTGVFGGAEVRIDAAWSLELVRPLFPTSAAVLIGRRVPAGTLPTRVRRFAGTLPRRDAHEDEADAALTIIDAPWPQITTLEGASPYRDRFLNGATIYPRRFFLVVREETGRFGGTRAAPRVRGRTGPLDKRPWLNIDPPSGPIEATFLRPLLLGEGIAPFRLIDTTLAVIPLDGRQVLDSAAAAAAGHRHLAAWLRDIEAKWAAHASRGVTGTVRINLTQQINHMHKLTRQAVVPGPRVVYAKAGTLLSAAIVEDDDFIIDHMAYWSSVNSIDEAHFLCTILNSRIVLELVAPMQPRGSFAPRHFDKLVWELSIPAFDASDDLHSEIAIVGLDAYSLAENIVLPQGHFTRKRRAIRDALEAAGLTTRMEALVARLLEP